MLLSCAGTDLPLLVFTKDLLFRCPPSLGQIALCIDGLVRRLRRPLPIRQHWRLVHRQQSPLRCLSRYAGLLGGPDRLQRISDHVGIGIFTAGCRLGSGLGAL